MAAAPVISECSSPDADAFLAQEWPRYDADLGIRWQSTTITLKATLASELAGVARGVVVGGLGELKQILVKKEFSRNGIGSRLLSEFEERCFSLGCHKIRLETGDYQARPFYERHGYTLAATLNHDRFNRTWFILEKSAPTLASKPDSR